MNRYSSPFMLHLYVASGFGAFMVSVTDTCCRYNGINRRKALVVAVQPADEATYHSDI